MICYLWREMYRYANSNSKQTSGYLWRYDENLLSGILWKCRNESWTSSNSVQDVRGDCVFARSNRPTNLSNWLLCVVYRIAMWILMWKCRFLWDGTQAYADIKFTGWNKGARAEANSVSPGGGARRGACAQEEDLCRKSSWCCLWKARLQGRITTTTNKIARI